MPRPPDGDTLVTSARSRVTARLRLASRVMAIIGLLLMVLAPFARAAEPGTVVVLPTTGIVDQVMAGYLRESIAAAATSGAPAVVVELDTPGGSLDATRDIVQTLLAAPVPVIVWVAPAGARAASAGTFITLAAQSRRDGPGHQHRGRVAGRAPRVRTSRARSATRS